MRLKNTNSFLAPVSLQTGSAPGHPIAKRNHAEESFPVDLATYTEAQDVQRLRYLRDGDEPLRKFCPYIVHVYIYCPTCACQIATALDICVYPQKSPFVDFHIRIDHHRPISCCPSMTNIDGLISIVEYLKEAERLRVLAGNFAEMVKAFHRERLDHAIYHAAEDEIAHTPSPEDRLGQIIGHHHEDEYTAAIVILGQADYCIRLVHAGPFPTIESGRVPREDQMFKLSQRYIAQNAGRRWGREYVRKYPTKAFIVSTRPPTSSSQDLEADKSSAESRKRPRSSD